MQILTVADNEEAFEIDVHTRFYPKSGLVYMFVMVLAAAGLMALPPPPLFYHYSTVQTQKLH